MMVTPLAGEAVGKILVEIGKALGKAIVAGIGLELARAATGHVKRAVGPKAPSDNADHADHADHAERDQVVSDAAIADELAKTRRENAALRRELEDLKRGAQSSTPPTE
jgi:hypothetical protein